MKFCFIFGIKNKNYCEKKSINKTFLIFDSILLQT
jgi:hypothetical protein